MTDDDKKLILEYITKIRDQLKNDGHETSCMAGRKVCIDCSFQLIVNTLNKQDTNEFS